MDSRVRTTWRLPIWGNSYPVTSNPETRGAFNYGANSVARYRSQAFCAYVRSIGKPVVLVQVNYRLGPLGFAISKDLVAEQEQSAPYIGNFGLLDQQNALQWVQDHIRDFGGDPDRVTAFGVSAGSASIHYHILSGQPLFDRAVMMSGTAGTLGPLPFHLYERAWQDLCTRHGTTDLNAADRLAALRALSADELIRTYSSRAMGPFGDGKLLPSTYDYTDPERESRCKAVILGDTRVEGIIFDFISQSVPQSELHNIFRKVMPDGQDYDGFCSNFGFATASYSLEQGNMPDDAYRDAVRLLMSVGTFQFPTLRVAETFASKQAGQRTAFLYHFEENSPYPGPTFGLSYHGQCALFLHMNELAQPDFPAAAATTCRDMAAAWAAFAHGEEPWPAFDPQHDKHAFMRWGPDGAHAMMTMKEDDARPYHYLPWVREHAQLLQKIIRALLQAE